MGNETAKYRHSNVKRYANCPLSWRYAEQLGLVGIAETGHHLHYGAAMHAGIAVLYKEWNVQEAVQAFLERYPRQIDEADLAKTREHGEYTLKQYATEYEDDLRRYEVLSNEQTDVMEDGYGVTLDRVLLERSSGQIFGVDTKTTGAYLNDDFYRKFSPNSQITQYYQYIKEKYGHCDGFYIDAVGLRFRQRASKDGPAGFWCRFERMMYNRTEQQIAQDTESRNDWIADIERSLETGIWRMNTDACKFCEFQKVCAEGWDWENDQGLILQHYRQVCGRRISSGEHCNLERGHEGDCAWTFPMEEQVEYTVVTD